MVIHGRLMRTVTNALWPSACRIPEGVWPEEWLQVHGRENGASSVSVSSGGSAEMTAGADKHPAWIVGCSGAFQAEEQLEELARHCRHGDRARHARRAFGMIIGAVELTTHDELEHGLIERVAQAGATATLNTMILIGSSVTMVMAWASLKMNDFGKFRMYLGATILLSFVFLVVKYFEYSHHLHAGEGPSYNTYYAIYYTITGLHGLHIIGGMSMPERKPPLMAAFRCSRFSESNRSKLTFWRFMLWATRTPVMPS